MPGKKKNGKRSNNNKQRTVVVHQSNRQNKSKSSKSSKNNSALGTLGRDIGQYAGNFVSKIFGLGAYDMKQNSIWDKLSAGQVPAMHSTDESIVFRHREYITDIVSSTSPFQATNYDINPGLVTSFPFLSQLAASFQQYRFRGLVYEFKSSSADALSATSTNLGYVALAAQYRSDAPTFTDKIAMMNEMWSVDVKPAENVLLPIECDPNENVLPFNYVRTGPLSPNQDKKFYDVARLCVATGSTPNANTIGELWVTYEIEFKKPSATITTTGANILAYTAISGNSSGGSPLGNSLSVKYNNMGASISGNTITLPGSSLPSGAVFEGEFSWHGTTLVAVSYPALTYTNANQLTWLDGAVAGTAPNSGETAGNVCYRVRFTVIDSNQPVTIAFGTAGTLPTTASHCHIIISQRPDADIGS